jgi:Family of unknown function (DUF5996)
MSAINDQRWPALPYDEWRDTYATLHMWSQIVGKIAVALAPPVNHSWAVTLRVTARGLMTLPLPHGMRSLTMEFDFIDHQLIIRTTDGEQRAVALAPRSVADFYREVMATLTSMALPVKINTLPVEIPAPIRFEQDTVHHSYDAQFAQRFWRILVQVERVFTDCRCQFIGKASPVQFFWGSFDLAVSRFSGKPAPPRDGPAWMQDAYSHEVISHGFWPGSGPLLEPAFYAYCVPEPAGFKDAQVQPGDAYYHTGINEFILPYDAARSAASPEQAIHSFIDSTYDRAATLAHWDRAALERQSGPRK